MDIYPDASMVVPTCSQAAHLYSEYLKLNLTQTQCIDTIHALNQISELLYTVVLYPRNS